MYENDLQELRRTILKAVSASSRQLLDEKVKSHSQIAVCYNDRVEVIQAKDAFRLNKAK
ncbi:MAG: hypothetical protein MJZ76_08115 [Bacteroidales bacterium]|nr:hypothetical protein [Bacteroidales bacterium]